MLKYFVYIWNGCGMHSKCIWSLNHDNTTSLGLGLSPIFLKSTPDLHRPNIVRAHTHAHPQHSKMPKHFVYIWHGCGMHSKCVCCLNHDNTTSLVLGLSPIFLKSTPDLHRCNSVRADYTPIHSIIKVLKYFWHGICNCVMYSLNIDNFWSIFFQQQPPSEVKPKASLVRFLWSM